jgi:DNA repair protein RadA/Sms
MFVCQSCGANSPKWIGKCNSCGEWNSLIEEIVSTSPFADAKPQYISKIKPFVLNDIQTGIETRIDTKNNELNRVLGGGLVPGSLVLLGGEPGIGKSTLLLQTVFLLNEHRCLYVSGEESLSQIKLRAERVGFTQSNCQFIPETQLESILGVVDQIKPEVVIIDSIQTVQTERIESSAGSVTQIRECTSAILKYAKEHNISFILVGHITKDGGLAGPKILEHTVDVVLQFEGDTNYQYRVIRSIKNRFGSTSEIGIFEMQASGLKEVSNPSEMLLSGNSENLSGVAIASTIEGVRPILVEVQALVSSAAYGMPQRSSNGFDLRRLNMLLAVLEKRAGFRLATKDVFLNIAGGLKITDPALDLAVIVAVLSSNFDLYVDKCLCFAAEVGLTGEVRSVNRIEQRISEAEKLGFTSIFVSNHNKKALSGYKGQITIHFVGKIEDVFSRIFKKKPTNTDSQN